MQLLGANMSPDQSPNSSLAEKNPQNAVARKALRLKKSKPTLAPALSAVNHQHQDEAAFAADVGIAQHTRDRLPPPRGPPSLPVRMLTKPEVLLIAGGVSYVTLWSWMRAGTFPGRACRRQVDVAFRRGGGLA